MRLKDTLLKTLRERSFWLIFFCSGLFVWFMLGTYEIQFSNAAAKLTNFAVGNGWNLRSYDDKGIPYSHLARLKKKVISPYYVVHSGLIYSQSVAVPSGYGWLWKDDLSFRYWGEDPPAKLITKNNFIHTADWIMGRIENDKFGNAHVFYHFSWPYKGTSGGYLIAPWYSGLTDAVAIKLLLQAYVVKNEKRYFDAASRLYDSVLKPIENGGALIYDEAGNPWVEEYIARNNKNNPFVLNGMVYATFAIRDYERFITVEHPMGNKLIQTIKIRLPEFDAGYWTRYDLIGTLAKPKYHFIHVALMKMLYQETNDPYFLEMSSRWGKYNSHFFIRHFLKKHVTINSLVVLSISFCIWVILTLLIYVTFRILKTSPKKASDLKGCKGRVS